MSKKTRRRVDAQLKAKGGARGVTQRGDDCRAGGEISASPKPDLRAGISSGEPANHAEMKQECEAKECHLEAKRVAAKVLSGCGEEHQKSG